MYFCYRKCVLTAKSKTEEWLLVFLLCSICVPGGPSYRAAVCPWPPSPWESAASDSLLTGSTHNLSTGGGSGRKISTGLFGGIQLHCTASISYRSYIFISLHSPEGKKRWTWVKKREKQDGALATFGSSLMIPFLQQAGGKERRDMKAAR